jgi:(1->4)-alpha-D-glucan 1-alpha-D-glucosylmutase
MTTPTITATYRLQLHAAFGFAAAKDVVDWLDDLGISHAYASPYLAAQKGSTHGYNLVDPTRLNPEIGTEQDYLAWTEALAAKGMGHIVDVVPNHMAASTENAWWNDVLENGPASLHAEHFDIEWRPPKAALENKVLLPILGAQYGEVLERGELRLERDGGSFCIRYFDRSLPVNPSTIAPLLERAAKSLDMPDDDPRRQDLESIARGLGHLPSVATTDPSERQERAREKEVLKRRLAAIVPDPAIAAAIDAEVARMNGTSGEPRSFDDLDRLLVDQAYRLAYWRVATEEINYRRFFDINDLAAVRMENDAVFDDAHGLLLRYVGDGRIQGIRLDHTDGLFDPEAYFAKLRAATDARKPYIVAEKILGLGEELPTTWQIDGTTGYDFLVQATGVFVDQNAEKAFTDLHAEITGDARTFAEHAREAKRAILRSSLSSELHMLAQRLERIAMRDRRSRDFTLAMLRRAIGETIAAFPVYRTYVRPDGKREPTDEAIVSRAIRLARRRNPEVSPSVFEFLRDVLLFQNLPASEEDRAERSCFAMRFQQLTGPVTAKAIEDTSFYTFVRFVALNEVGGMPERFGTSVVELHSANARRREKWPRTMTASSTHDTKRGEDIRARLAVTSEIPDLWSSWVREWDAIAGRHVTSIDEEDAPSGVDRLLFFQTAVGALPFDGRIDEGFVTRLTEYMIKAAREAKQRTSWLAPDESYEEALRTFVTRMMADDAFEKSLIERAASIATYGASNGLAQVLLKIAAPGIPDTYQGSETWDLRLVDPDNRGPVDYATLRALSAAVEGKRPRDLLFSFRDGGIKLFVVRTALRLRRRMPDLFIEGDYVPILERGDPDVVAFTRSIDRRAIACIVTRQPWHVTQGRAPWACGDVWSDRRIAVPEGRWTNAFTGQALDVAKEGAKLASIFDELPVALLMRES